MKCFVLMLKLFFVHEKSEINFNKTDCNKSTLRQFVYIFNVGAADLQRLSAGVGQSHGFGFCLHANATAGLLPVSWLRSFNQ